MPSQRYCTSLFTLKRIQDYYSPLKSILSAGALEYLFQNIEEIARTSTRFLQALQERQKENDFIIMKIGDVVEPFVSFVFCDFNGLYSPGFVC